MTPYKMTVSEMRSMEMRANEILEELQELVEDLHRCADRIYKRGAETSMSRADSQAIRDKVRRGDRMRTAELMRVVAGHIDVVVEQLDEQPEEDSDE